MRTTEYYVNYRCPNLYPEKKFKLGPFDSYEEAEEEMNNIKYENITNIYIYFVERNYND
jgi:hypothetical protein